MTFTELEFVLMIAIAVLLWRNNQLDKARNDAVYAADKFAGFLIMIGKGKGTVVPDGDDFKFEEKK